MCECRLCSPHCWRRFWYTECKAIAHYLHFKNIPAADRTQAGAVKDHVAKRSSCAGDGASWQPGCLWISTQSCPQTSVDKSLISVRIIQTENALQTCGTSKWWSVKTLGPRIVKDTQTHQMSVRCVFSCNTNLAPPATLPSGSLAIDSARFTCSIEAGGVALKAALKVEQSQFCRLPKWHKYSKWCVDTADNLFH